MKDKQSPAVSFPEWQHRFVATRVVGKLKITVTAGLHHMGNNPLPYWSVTGNSFEKLGNGHWNEAGGGCIHDEIARFWPKLKPAIRVHLSDSEGAPMHALGNAEYWLGGIVDTGARYHGGSGSSARSAEECRRILREHLRIDENELGEIVDSSHPLETLRAKVEELRPRWQAESNAVAALLDSLSP